LNIAIIIIWAMSSSVALYKLFCFQKRAIRLIANAEWNAHTAPLFREFNILTIHQLNLLHVASFMYKVYNNLFSGVAWVPKQGGAKKYF
jgi:hypothetical protein